MSSKACACRSSKATTELQLGSFGDLRHLLSFTTCPACCYNVERVRCGDNYSHYFEVKPCDRCLKVREIDTYRGQSLLNLDLKLKIELNILFFLLDSIHHHSNLFSFESSQWLNLSLIYLTVTKSTRLTRGVRMRRNFEFVMSF